MVDDPELLEEKAEARHNETKAHQGQAGANPGEKCSFGGKIVAEVGSARNLRWSIHFVPLMIRVKEEAHIIAQERRDAGR